MNWLGDHVSYTAPVLSPLWFLRDLMVVFLLTPIIFYLIRKFSFYPLILIGLAYVSRIWPDISGFTASSLFYFSFGAFFSLTSNSIVAFLYKLKPYILYVFIFLSIICALLGGCSTIMGNILLPFCSIIGTLSAFTCALYFCNKEVPHIHFLSGSSFFLYASHYIIISIYRWLIDEIGIYPENFFLKTFLYLLIPLIITSISLSLYSIMKGYTPKILSLLMGSR